ncbi:MAG: hypothetical protein AB4040_14690 [Synechococcus sp.]
MPLPTLNRKPLRWLWWMPLLLWPSAAIAQSSNLTFEVAVEILQDAATEVLRDIDWAGRDVWEDMFGGGSPTASSNLADAVGDLGYPDLSVARTLAREGATGQFDADDLASNPTVMSLLGGEYALHALLERTVNFPISLEEQQALMEQRQEHLTFLAETLAYAQQTAEDSYRLTESTFQLDLTAPVARLEDVASSARSRSATQDVLKDMALAYPALGQQNAQIASLLQTLSNQTALLDYAVFYNSASLVETQAYLGQLALEAKLDRGLTAHMALEQSRQSERENLHPHLQMQADAIGAIELSGNIGFARENLQ